MAAIIATDITAGTVDWEVNGAEWERIRQAETRRQHEAYLADEARLRESRALLSMAQQQTNLLARAAEFADRSRR